MSLEGVGREVGSEADCKILIVFSIPFNFVRSASTSCSARFRSFVISGLRREEVEDRWVEIVVWGRTRNFWSCQLIDPHHDRPRGSSKA